MDSYRKNGIIVGILFIIGTVGYSIGLVAIAPVLDGPGYLVNGSEHWNTVLVGALFVLFSGVALVGIPVVMYPLFKGRSKPLAKAYVGFRTLEMVCYTGMVVVVLLLIALSHDFVNAGDPEDPRYATLGERLLEAYDWFDLVLIFVFALGAHVFYYLLYVTRLVPRSLSVWGLLGASAWLSAPVLALLGTIEIGSIEWMLLALPIAVNEMVLAVYLLVKGFNHGVDAPGPQGPGTDLAGPLGTSTKTS